VGTSTAASEGKLDAFEGIRGLASLTVFLGHLVIAFWPVLYNPGHPLLVNYPRWAVWLAEGPTRVLIDGQYAVVLFFLLSGFVLSLGFFRNPAGDSLISGAARRYLRLMIPAATSILLACFVMKQGWMFNQWAAAHMTVTLQMPHVWLTYFFNFEPTLLSAGREAVYDQFFLGKCRYNSNLWTMSVELAGSFLVYAFVALFGRLRGRGVFYLCVGAVLILTGRYFMVQFLLGVAIADVFAIWERANRPIRIPALVGFGTAYLAFYVVGNKPIQGNYTVLGAEFPKSLCCETASGLLLVFATAFCPALQWAFSRRPFVFLGRISFTLYLVHLIAICSLACYVYLKLQVKAGMTHHQSAIVASFACIATSTSAAWILYRLVDRPSIILAGGLYKRWFKPVQQPSEEPKILVFPPPRIAKTA